MSDQKTALRTHLLDLRRYEAEQMPKAGEALTSRVPGELTQAGFSMVAGYAPMRGEIEPGGVMALLRHHGAQLCLPCVEGGPDTHLVFRAWTFGDPLVSGPMGVRQPPTTADAVTPDAVLTPCVGFDLDGHRLGYGGGYYDRTLAQLRRSGSVTPIILAYEIQRIEVAPAEPHDERADWIITESAAYQVRVRESVGGE